MSIIKKIYYAIINFIKMIITFIIKIITSIFNIQPKDKKKKEELKKNPPPEEEEETYMYAKRKPMEFINEGKNGVFDIKYQTGINTAKSVFDKSIFHTHD
jgi:hypothetical protein